MGVPDQDDADDQRKARHEEIRAIVCNAAADGGSPADPPSGNLPEDVRAAIDTWLKG